MLLVDGFRHPFHQRLRHDNHNYHPTRSSVSNTICVAAAGSKGFGGGGGGGMASQTKKNKKGSSAAGGSSGGKKSLMKQIEQKYGGSTPQDIARGTQAMIDKSIQQLPEHLQLALQLYRQQLDWNRRISGMDLLAQSQLPPQAFAQAQQMQETLESILQEHSLSVQDLQVTMQQITWDASADAKAAKSLTGTMPRDIQNRVQRACDYAAEAIAQQNDDNDNDNDGDGDSLVLDVGCGYGVLVPYLQKAGVRPSQIHGMDLSPEMIRNAQSFYPEVTFEVANFLDLDVSSMDTKKYRAIVFCASLHDLPNMQQALQHASQLLQVGGRHGSKLIIVHPQGASHVLQQHKSNPMLVPRGLPTAAELEEWLCNDHSNSEGGSKMVLTVDPASAKSDREIREGYLAVLTKH
jgi:2-polyprenyl-3-methyl-5-hydroxy-6-metoxy-1,4-benzoquinol methylase